MAEIEALHKLKHLNIIELIEYGKNILKHPKKGSKEITYLVLELATGGELFDFIAETGAFEEHIARFYLK